MKKKRRIKKQVYYIIGIIIIFIIATISMIKYIKYINSNPYKLEKIGYNEKEIETILTLEDEQIKKVLENEYNKQLPKFMKQTYFIFDNLDRYISYYNDHKDVSYEKIVALVNVKADYEWYDEDIVTKQIYQKEI